MARNHFIGFYFVFMLFFSGCATTAGLSSSSPDQVAQSFIDDLQAEKRRAAYALLTKGQAEHTSFDDFNDVIESIEEKMGKISEAETVIMPFHRPADDGNFIPLRVAPQQVKRYIYQLHYGNASINCDLTLVPEDGQYHIAWFSFWK